MQVKIDKSKLCAVPCCDRRVASSAGYCRNHTIALRRYGSPTAVKSKTCRHCGDQFTSPANCAVFCSEKCRFLDKVDTTGGFGPEGDCWEWKATKHGKGYGHFKSNPQKGAPVEKAHRVAFRLLCDHEPGNLLVCHTCDNPACVNPDHLFLATNTVNLLDRQRKGRQARGETHSKAKLKEIDVIALRNGADDKLIARKRGMQISAVRSAALGRTWTHMNETHPPVDRQ